MLSNDNYQSCVSLCVCPSLVTAEMVRLSTENDYLKQEKEKLEETGSKMSQKAASLVSQPTHSL